MRESKTINILKTVLDKSNAHFSKLTSRINVVAAEEGVRVEWEH